jgi:ABC-2 type transport system permease protein
VIRLVGAELRRLAWRRLSMITALALVAVVALFQVVVVLEVKAPSAAELQQQYQQAHDSWSAQHERTVADCVSGGDTRENCESYDPEPQAADFTFVAPEFADLGGVALVLGTSVAMLASYLVSASLIGAEYSTGSLANWLTFVPRRMAVLGAKLVAVVTGSALAGFCTIFANLGLAALLTHRFGLPLTGAGPLTDSAGRGVALAVLAGLLGFAAALLTRHTVAALGIVLGYLVVGTVLQALAFEADGPFGGLPPWLPDNNVQAFLKHGYSYTQFSARAPEGTVQHHLGFAHSALYWAAVLVVALVSAALVFRRRDVT